MINLFIIGALILGVIIGLIIGVAIFAILAFFRASIEYKIKVVEKVLGNAGPRQKGAIIMPDDEADIIRREHIKRNREAGKDTPISELQ